MDKEDSRALSRATHKRWIVDLKAKSRKTLEKGESLHNLVGDEEFSGHEAPDDEKSLYYGRHRCENEQSRPRLGENTLCVCDKGRESGNVKNPYNSGRR